MSLHHSQGNASVGFGFSVVSDKKESPLVSFPLFGELLRVSAPFTLESSDRLVRESSALDDEEELPVCDRMCPVFEFFELLLLLFLDRNMYGLANS